MIHQNILQALTISCALMIGACTSDNTTSDETNEPILEITAPIAFVSQDSLSQRIRPTSQHFQIVANEDQTIKGEGGTIIYIPKHTFVNNRNEVIEGTVDIEVIEILSKEDMLRANLSTMSNGDVLVSEGMLFIEAQANGEPVAVAENKALQITMPKMKGSEADAPTVDIFAGSFNPLGATNWERIGTVDKRLVPLPLDLFDYEYITSFEYIRVKDNQGYGAEDNSDSIDSVTLYQPALENTFIATREFQERFYHICAAQSAIGHYTSYYSTTSPQRGRMVMDSTILSIYLDNLDKDLWYCDSLTLDYMKTWEGRVDYYGYFYSETEKTDLLAVFEAFYKERLENVIELPKGIDLGSENARTTLEQEGFSSEEIDKIIGTYVKQEAFKNTLDVLVNSFETNQLGWINCDWIMMMAIGLDGGKEVTFDVNIQEREKYPYLTVSLVFDGRNSALFGRPLEEDNARYAFDRPPTPLFMPLNEKATVIAMSYSLGQLYLGVEEVNVGKNNRLDMELKKCTEEELDKVLKAL